jgi:hypothetical protein
MVFAPQLGHECPTHLYPSFSCTTRYIDTISMKTNRYHFLTCWHSKCLPQGGHIQGKNAGPTLEATEILVVASSEESIWMTGKGIKQFK